MTFQITDHDGKIRNFLDYSTAAALAAGPVMVRTPAGVLVPVDPSKTAEVK